MVFDWGKRPASSGPFMNSGRQTMSLVPPKNRNGTLTTMFSAALTLDAFCAPKVIALYLHEGQKWSFSNEGDLNSRPSDIPALRAIELVSLKSFNPVLPEVICDVRLDLVTFALRNERPHAVFLAESIEPGFRNAMCSIEDRFNVVVHRRSSVIGGEEFPVPVISVPEGLLGRLERLVQIERSRGDVSDADGDDAYHSVGIEVIDPLGKRTTPVVSRRHNLVDALLVEDLNDIGCHFLEVISVVVRRLVGASVAEAVDGHDTIAVGKEVVSHKTAPQLGGIWPTVSEE